MNQVDASYRAEFRDLFETHSSRFDAKLEQRIAETKAELHAEMAGLRGEVVGLRQSSTHRLASQRRASGNAEGRGTCPGLRLCGEPTTAEASHASRV